ncbi:MAG TPA: GAF domain-containing sensor histidine kinase [Streptosporangiaceae bacterium]|nr:GAF domain-containing sensor histidine kinase [Streptosporangiaceae bacterium]
MAGSKTDGERLDQVLYQVSQAVLAVTRQVSVHDALETIVKSARSLLGARYAALGVPSADGSFAEFVVAGMTSREQAAIGPLPRQHGMLGVLLREGRPQRLGDIRADPRFEYFPAAHPVLADFLGVPIKDGQDVLGIIFLANKRVPGGFTERDEELLCLFAAHAAIALTNARLYERSRELSVIEERARLARDLHDAVSQKLFGIRVKARAAAILVPKDPARAAAELQSVAQLGVEAYAELRAVIDGLLPPDLTTHGLAESVRRYAEVAGRAHGRQVRFHAGDLPWLGAETDEVVYRVAQEALHNALRHAGGHEVRVTLCREAAGVILEVADDGPGFAQPAVRPGALGLASMRDRASSVGGSLAVASAPGAGTTVRLTIPARAGRHGAGRNGAGRHSGGRSSPPGSGRS